MNHYGQLASAVINNIRAGLAGYQHNPSLDRQQVEDEIVWTQQKLIKDYMMKGLLPIKELMLTLRCIKVDCQDIERCTCWADGCGEKIAHFQIPQVYTDLGNGSTIYYIGTIDMMQPFLWFTNVTTMQWAKYSRRGNKLPRVFVDITPNENNFFDCFIFNAPLITHVTVQAVFKDPRQFFERGCCEDIFGDDDLTHNMSFIDREAMDYVTSKYIVYYRQLMTNERPNDQMKNRP